MVKEYSSEKWDLETDVVVVGSGAAGLTAAVVAANEGLKVILLEKTDKFGGATAFSGGGIWCPNNKFLRDGYQVDVYDKEKKTWVKQRIDGEIGREMAIKYLKRLALGMSSDKLIETYVDTIWRAVDYLEQHTRLKVGHVRLMPEYYPEWSEYGAVRSGRTVEPELYDVKTMPPELAEKIRLPPLTYPVKIDEIDHWGGTQCAYEWDLELIGKRVGERLVGMGLALVCALLHSCYEKGVDLRTETPVRHLIVKGGRVIGIIAEHRGKELWIHARKGVILCAGGFDWNESMTKAFLRGPSKGPAGPPCNTGDGIRLGIEVGAQLSQMTEAWWYPTGPTWMTYEGKPVYFSLLYEKACPGTIIVNKYGKRFVNECTNYRSLGRAWHVYDPAKHEFPNYPSYLIFDQACHRRYMILTISPFDELPEPPFYKGETLRELAQKINVDPDGLEETVKRFNLYAKEGKDPDFHRGESWYDQFYGDYKWKERGLPHPNLAPIETPPFYAIEILPGYLGTAGGLLINEKAQVLDWDNKPISGLYAAGNNTATCMGMGYPGGGGTIGPAICFGYIAAKEVAKQ